MWEARVRICMSEPDLDLSHKEEPSLFFFTMLLFPRKSGLFLCYVLILFLIGSAFSGGRGGVSLRKIWCSCGASFLKPLPYFRPTLTVGEVPPPPKKKTVPNGAKWSGVIPLLYSFLSLRLGSKPLVPWPHPCPLVAGQGAGEVGELLFHRHPTCVSFLIVWIPAPATYATPPSRSSRKVQKFASEITVTNQATWENFNKTWLELWTFRFKSKRERDLGYRSAALARKALYYKQVIVVQNISELKDVFEPRTLTGSLCFCF